METSIPRAELVAGPRYHRVVVGLSGLVLFVCGFLPAVQGCDGAVFPIDVPMCLPPYVLGLVFALGATAAGPRGIVATVEALRAVAVLMVIGSSFVGMFAPSAGAPELVVSAVLLAVIGASGHSEGRAAATALVVGGLGSVWFGLWTTSHAALIGVHLALVASLGLAAGGLAWWRECYNAAHEGIPCHRASRARRRL